MAIIRGLDFAYSTIPEIEKILDELESLGARITAIDGGVAPANFVFQYEQDTDPGAVGAGVWWADTLNHLIYLRNATNDGWISFGGGEATTEGFDFLTDPSGNLLTDPSGNFLVGP
jgi:hypothetical protein